MEGNSILTNSCPLLGCLLNLDESMHRMTLTNRGKKTRIATNVHAVPVQDSKGICHGAVIILHDVSPEHSLEERVENLHNRATRDALTGVGNRAEFDRRHLELVDSHSQNGEPLSLIICDIDKFKTINDTYGHQAGDAALIEFAGLIARLSRGNDLVARYGGEEFVLLCPGCSSEAASKKAEEIRRKLAATSQPALNNTKMTASFGVAEFRDGDTPESMLKRADEALYEAKETGRNRVVTIGNSDEASSDRRTLTSSWFSWPSKGNQDKLLHRMLKCTVPVNVVTEKVRGFISDNNAEVISASEGAVELRFDEKTALGARRQNDRPYTLSMRIELKTNAEEGQGTLIDVRIHGNRGRDRRLEDLIDRAEQLHKRLKAYLIAEDY